MTHAQKIFAEYRKKTGLTQVEIAKVFGISQATVSQIEAGNTDPSADIVLKILERSKKVKAA